MTEQNGKVKGKEVVMPLSGFIVGILAIGVSWLAILGLFSDINTKLSVIRNQHELRLQIIEGDIKDLKRDVKAQGDKVNHVDQELDNHLDIHYGGKINHIVK